MSKMNIADKDRPRVKFECLRLLATLRLDPARMQLISGFIDSYLRLNEQEIQIFQAEIDTIESSEKEAAMKIITSWMEEGIEQGKQSEALSLIMRLLPRKVGTIAPELQQHIQQLSLTQLEDLAEDLLDFSDIADLAAWLDQIPVAD